MKEKFEMFRMAMLAGASISIGCVVYLSVGGVAGAVLFAFGLLTCVHFKLPLYTGTAGFVGNGRQMADLGLILLGNIAGCLAMAAVMRHANPAISEAAAAVTAKRAALQWWQTGALALFCGFIMTVAVKFGRQKQFLPLIFGVPVFILCGFIHSIADAFYIQVSPMSLLCDEGWAIFANYVSAVAGNFVGCNLYRLAAWRMEYSE